MPDVGFAVCKASSQSKWKLRATYRLFGDRLRRFYWIHKFKNKSPLPHTPHCHFRSPCSQFCLETFHGQPPADLSLTTVYVFLDGCPDEDVQLKNETFQALSSLVGLHVSIPEISFKRRRGKSGRSLLDAA